MLTTSSVGRSASAEGLRRRLQIDALSALVPVLLMALALGLASLQLRGTALSFLIGLLWFGLPQVLQTLTALIVVPRTGFPRGVNVLLLVLATVAGATAALLLVPFWYRGGLIATLVEALLITGVLGVVRLAVTAVVCRDR